MALTLAEPDTKEPLVFQGSVTNELHNHVSAEPGLRRFRPALTSMCPQLTKPEHRSREGRWPGPTGICIDITLLGRFGSRWMAQTLQVQQ